MPNRIWIFAVLGWLCCGIAPAYSVPESEHYTVDVWTTEEGLPENTVIAMTQTRDGYLWLGTFNGSLVRFDGIHFTSFDENNTPGLDTSPVVFLFEDSRTNLWVGTQAAGVMRIKDGQVTREPIGGHSREGRLIAVSEDSEGAVWFFTADGQLFRYRDGKVEVCHINTLGDPSYGHTMIAEKSGTIWVGTDRIGGARMFGINPKLAPGQGFLEQVLEVTNHLDYLLASKQGGYFRLAGGEVQKWNEHGLERNLGPYPSAWDPITTRIHCACEDWNGNLVVGTSDKGVWLFDMVGKAAPAHIEGLSHETILSLCQDREGDLWVGTDSGGLDRVKRQVFKVVPESLGKTVLSVCEDHDGSILFGVINDALNRWQGGEVRRLGVGQSLAGASGSIAFVMPATSVGFRSVFVDHDRKIWAAAIRAGLWQIEKERFEQAPGAESLKSISDQISVIHEDRSNRMWLGAQDGLALRNGDGWKIFTKHDNLSSSAIRAIADDADGNLWIGTDTGLSCLRNGQFTALHKKDGLPSEHIYALYADSQGCLWIGTSGGLARLLAGKLTPYTTRDGLSGNSIDYIIEDDQHNLWLGSNAGLMRVSKKDLNDFAQGLIKYIACRSYGKADGLPTRECTQGSQPAACRARDGTLWFATIRGLVFVNPNDLKPNTNPPPVAIESVWINGEAVEKTNSIRASLASLITVPAGRDRVDIQYTSLNLAAANKARFRYRMEGHETAWTDADANTRIAHYPKLPPGDYTFHVKACNEDGFWNEAGATLGFQVEPPFWQKWWFRSAVVIFVFGWVSATVYYFSTQKLQRQLGGLRQQQALEKDRARIARDIHDQLGASLTQVSMLGEMVESDKNHPEEVEAHARQISQTARDTSRVLDEIVWTVNPSNDTLDGLINYVCKYAQDYLAVAGLRYRLDVPAQLPATPISPEVRHNVFLAAKEAITNVVRHAKATEVWLRLRLEPGSFTLEIQDNGRGPAGLEGKQSRNGLRNMHKRMEDVGGRFAITAAPEGGALVRLTVPVIRVD